MDRARAGVLGFRGGVVAYAFFMLMVAVPALGVVSLPGWRVSGVNTAGFGWEANEVRWAGLRIMSGANTTLFWSVKSLWSGMERMRNGG